MDKKHIVIVDDDNEMVKSTCECLEYEGYRAEGFSGAETLFDFLNTEMPDLILLDVGLLGISGFEICKILKGKEKFHSIPIIIITGKGKEEDKVYGLDMGADDYIIKPFSVKELNARIRAVLRRSDPGAFEKKITIDNIVEIDMQGHSVAVNGEEINLTLAEFKILELLASHKGQVFTRGRILEFLWGHEKIVIERTIDVHIRHLREKLGEEAGELIKNIRGVGYKLTENGGEE